MNTDYNKISKTTNDENEITKEIEPPTYLGDVTNETIEEPVVEKEPKNTQEKDTAPKKAVVTASKLNLREAGSKSADIICVLNNLEEVSILSNKKTGWSKVMVRNDITGYVMTEFLKEK